MPYAKSDGRSSRAWKELTKRLRVEREPVCWICGGWIDLLLPHNDARAWTLDHIKSMDQFPEINPLDESNLSPAHRDCNGRKGAGTIEPTPTGTRIW